MNVLHMTLLLSRKILAFKTDGLAVIFPMIYIPTIALRFAKYLGISRQFVVACGS